MIPILRKAAIWALSIAGFFFGVIQILMHMSAVPFGFPVMIAYVVFFGFIFVHAVDL